MNATKSFQALTTLLLSVACSAGISALVIIGPELARSGNPYEQPTSPSVVHAHCFMPRLNWSAADGGPVPCARQAGPSSAIETMPRNRLGAKPVHPAPCFMAPLAWPTAEAGPVPSCRRCAGN